MKYRFLFIANLTFACLTFFIYYSANISPAQFWPAGFTTFLIPAAIVINLLFVIWWLSTANSYAIISVITLLFGYRFIASAYPLHFFIDRDKVNDSFTILTYNVRVFNSYKHLRSDESYVSSKKMLKFILDEDADVVCLQEFYNDKNSKIFNTVNKLSKKYPFYYISADLKNIYGNQFGQAIFSKYPLINKGTVHFSQKTKNGAIYADVKINNVNLRIYNIHLQSMRIDEERIVNAMEEKETRKNVYKELKKLKYGMIDRALQVDRILADIKKSGKKIIICGDINDTPFSYTYNKLKQYFNNAHEKAGIGWGTTYNGKLPLLRIDNQFADERIKIIRSKTYFEANYSDHFPLSVTYSGSDD